MKKVIYKTVLTILAFTTVTTLYFSGTLTFLEANGYETFKEIGEVNNYKDEEFGWMVEVPTDWTSLVAFENPGATGIIIQRRVIFYTSSSEIITVDVWRNDNKKSLKENYESLEAIFQVENDRAKGENGIVAGLPAILSANLRKNNQGVRHKSLMIQNNKFIYRINYSIKNESSEHAFDVFIKNFNFVNGKNLKYDIEKLPKLSKKLLSKVSAGEDNCGPNGEYTLQGNPFSCSICSATYTNCTWWAIYKRPDLKTKITWGNAGQDWITQANQANLTVHTDAVQGAISVWGPVYNEQGVMIRSGHVAYVNSVTNSSSFSISEMNCNNTSYPGPRDANANKNYSSSWWLPSLGFIGGGGSCSSQVTNLQINSGQSFTCSLPSITILPETLFYNGSTVNIKAQ